MFGGGGLIGLATKAYGALKNRKKSSDGSSSDDGSQSYHKGGKVKKTGLARLKKGERVLTKGQQKKLLKKGGRK